MRVQGGELAREGLNDADVDAKSGCYLQALHGRGEQVEGQLGPQDFERVGLKGDEAAGGAR